MTIARLLLPGVLLASCSLEESAGPLYDVAQAETRTIEVSVGSAGIVEPLSTVEVKSKASGEVLELLVETGDFVDEGALLVRIDPRIVSNVLAQSQAELKAARSRRAIAQAQMERAESLVQQGTFTETDYEEAMLALANAEADVVRAEVSVENARIAVDDTEIRAPISGTVILKPVEKGQVISSPTQDVAGGTVLLTMADLGAVQIRALIDETDIGKVRPGMKSQIAVAAYPNQPFPGEVTKIEPQAVLDQNVTMFAVLISIRNPDGFLLPGMNAEVDVSVARSVDVLTVPVMALRTERDIPSTADILGMSEADLRSRLQPADKPVNQNNSAGTITLRGQTIDLPDGVSAEQVRELMAKRRNGEELSPDEGKTLRRVFQAVGGGKESSKPASDFRFGGDFWLVVDEEGTREIRSVRAGLTDLDRVEIIAGLSLGESVLILPSAHLVETQEQLQRFITRRVGGVPGIN